MWVSDGATVTLNNCTLARNTISNTSSSSALITAYSVDPSNIEGTQQDTILRLQDVTIAENTAKNDIVATTEDIRWNTFDVGIYTDVEIRMYFIDDLPSTRFTLPLAQAPIDRPGLTASSPWFVELKEVQLPQLCTHTCDHSLFSEVCAINACWVHACNACINRNMDFSNRLPIRHIVEDSVHECSAGCLVSPPRERVVTTSVHKHMRLAMQSLPDLPRISTAAIEPGSVTGEPAEAPGSTVQSEPPTASSPESALAPSDGTFDVSEGLNRTGTVPDPTEPEQSDDGIRMIVIIAVAVAVVALCLAAVAAVAFRRRKAAQRPKYGHYVRSPLYTSSLGRLS